jgi:hypothetical protein
MLARTAALLTLAFLTGTTAGAQVVSGQRYDRLAIRNAMIVDGNGTPARGPADVVVQGNTIAEVVWLDPVAVKAQSARRPRADVEIDATGKYLLPGLINAHGHVQEERGGIAQPLDYSLRLWLASGVTTVREVGSAPWPRRASTCMRAFTTHHVPPRPLQPVIVCGR